MNVVQASIRMRERRDFCRAAHQSGEVHVEELAGRHRTRVDQQQRCHAVSYYLFLKHEITHT